MTTAESRSVVDMQNAAATESAMHNVFTLQQDTGDRQTELGNLYLAAKISPLAVSPKSFQGDDLASLPLCVMFTP